MLRAAAKNHERVVVVCDPADYDRVLNALADGELPRELKQELAVKAFAHTARYDAAISGYLNGVYLEDGFPESLALVWDKAADLRYGENPHQKAAFYRLPGAAYGIAGATQLQGKPLSFNNLADADAAANEALDRRGISHPRSVVVDENCMNIHNVFI